MPQTENNKSRLLFLITILLFVSLLAINTYLLLLLVRQVPVTESTQCATYTKNNTQTETPLSGAGDLRTSPVPPTAEELQVHTESAPIPANALSPEEVKKMIEVNQQSVSHSVN